MARLGEFTKFSQLAQTRIGTVQSIASARFDWHGALSDLAKVIPANTTLQSVVGTVVPGANSGGTGAGGTGSIRSDISAPAFELSGCTRTQDDVAKLMSQLRLINGVTRVTISDSQMSNSSAAASTSGSTQGCGANSPNFDLVVFFSPVANAGPAGVTSVTGASTTTTTTGGYPVTGRDRIVIMVVLAVGAVVAGWMLVVSPKRQQASTLGTQISAQQSQLDAARSQLAAGEAARSAFAGQYEQLAKLGEAVPPDDDVPSLIYQVQNAAQGAKVSFRGLQLGNSPAASSRAHRRARAPAPARARAPRPPPRRSFRRVRRSARPVCPPSSSPSR